MTKSIIYIMILCLMKGVLLFSQSKSAIKFGFNFGASTLRIDSAYQLHTNDSIKITALRFYVSNIELIDNHKTVWKDATVFRLMDIADSKSTQISIPSSVSFSKLKFNIGIDSTTNVSGAMGGDLDPTKGMYWTWQSGYINFKLEGSSNLCRTRHNEFQFHLGGYTAPFNNLQIIFVNDITNKQVEILFDIQKLMKQINLTQQHHIMSPGTEAMEFSEKLINSMSIKK